MPDTIESEISVLQADYPRLAGLRDEYLFSMVCLKYFYNDGDFDYRDYSETFADGRDDGGIDLITVAESEESLRLILIQSKLITSLSNTQDVIDVFTKIDQTYRDFVDYRRAGYNARLKRILVHAMSEVEDKSPTINLVLFLSTDISEERKEDIERELERIEALQQYDKQVFYRSDIEEQIKNIKDPIYFVAEDKIKIDRPGNMIKYKDHGLLVSVSANSLKDLYCKYKERGLFEQNYRYFVRNKRIDDSILRSLHEKRDSFWFLNNGIIIGCKDWRPDGQFIKLYDFSIINGCQTTTLIGEYDQAGDDFFIPCKIVKPEDEARFIPFISEIAEASNSQKPISDRDLKSNSPEQRILQRRLQENEPRVYLEVKRGEKLLSTPRKRLLQPWQYLKNDLYGQTILSFYLQAPCTARSNKKKVFADQSTYAKIFRRPVDKPGLVDVLKISAFYQQFVNRKLQERDFSSTTQEVVATHGDFVILALAGFMAKKKRSLVDLRKVSSEQDWELELTNDNLNGALLADLPEEEREEKLSGFFNGMIEEIADLYDSREQEEKTVSNFFKSDSKYRNIILKKIIDHYLRRGAARARDAGYFLELFT
jgi:hypothetical protein